MNQLTVIILAGGEGKRMQSALPKVLQLFKNKPMLVRVIETCQEINPDKLIVVTGKFDDIIQRTLTNYIATSEICFVKQESPLGTADAVKCCLPYLLVPGHVLIINGDMPCITSSILNKMVQSSYDAVLLGANLDDPTGYGRLITDQRKNIVAIVEEKDCTDTEKQIKAVNTGIYYLHESYLQQFIPKIKNDNAQNEFYLTDVVKLMRNIQIPVQIIFLEKNENIFIRGVNTKQELLDLENQAS